LIDTIQNDMVKSAELTGSGKTVERYWKGTFTAAAFINNMKRMVEAVWSAQWNQRKYSHVGSIQKQEAKVEEESSRNF
jgi:DNA topoisomerase-3